MKYPVRVSDGSDGWCVLDADGQIVGRAFTEADANTIRDAMNKCAPPPMLPLSVVVPFDCWAYEVGSSIKPYNCEASEASARNYARALGPTSPVRGRFIPDNATAEQVYAEVARLLNLLEPSIGTPHVERSAGSKFIDAMLDVDMDGANHAIKWTREDVETIFERIGDDIDASCEEIRTHVNWSELHRDHAADQDADTRMRTRKADDAE